MPILKHSFYRFDDFPKELKYFSDILTLKSHLAHNLIKFLVNRSWDINRDYKKVKNDIVKTFKDIKIYKVDVKLNYKEGEIVANPYIPYADYESVEESLYYDTQQVLQECLFDLRDMLISNWFQRYAFRFTKSYFTFHNDFSFYDGKTEFYLISYDKKDAIFKDFLISSYPSYRFYEKTIMLSEEEIIYVALSTGFEYNSKAFEITSLLKNIKKYGLDKL